MVNFGRRLSDQARQEWSIQYIDYECLKSKLYDVLVAKQNEHEQFLLEPRKHIFQGALDEEVQKVLNFYAFRREELLRELSTVATSLIGSSSPTAVDSKQPYPGNSPRKDGYALHDTVCATTSALSPHAADCQRQDMHQLVAKLKWLSGELRWLLHYITLNMVAIRKIVKKCSKHFDSDRPNPGHLVLEIGHPDDAQWKRLQASCLPASTADRLMDMQRHFDLRQAVHTVEECIVRAQQKIGCDTDAASCELGLQQECIALGEVSKSLQDVGHEAQHEAQYVVAIGWQYEHQAGVFEPPPPDEAALATPSGLLLNCISCCLYMANYTVLLPFIEDISQHMHRPVSNVSSLVGMSDLANIFGTVAYSWWTNTHFKNPLMFSCAACMLSNVVLLAGYCTTSYAALMAARFILGCGSARTINRRYIADFVSKANRTKASIAFVCASTIGMSLGPLLAFPLGHLPTFTFHTLYFTPVTASAALFVSAWTMTMVWCCLAFEEPKSGCRLTSSSSSSLHVLLKSSSPSSSSSSLHALLMGDNRGREDRSDVQTVHRDSNVPVVSDQRDGALLTFWRSVASAWPQLTVCLLSLLLLKTFQQCYSAALPLLTNALVGWGSESVGVFMGALGVSMMPINFLAAHVSTSLSDRALILTAITAVLSGLVSMSQAVTHHWMYFAGGFAMFSGTVVWEGSAMSLTSKVIPKSLARGVLNAGLLTTEAGTLGRFTGNAVLSVLTSCCWNEGAHHTAALRRFVWLLHGSLATMAALLLCMLLIMYNRLRD